MQVQSRRGKRRSSPACLVVQLVKNPPAMQETRVRSLGWEDPLEEGKATHSRILAWRPPGQRSLAGCSPQGRRESDTTERLTPACLPSVSAAGVLRPAFQGHGGSPLEEPRTCPGWVAARPWGDQPSFRDLMSWSRGSK